MTTTITDGKVVQIHYKLTLDDGQVVDSSEGRDPLAYLHGASNIVPGLESQLAGQAEGASVEATVTPEDGYGERSEEGVQKVPRDAFPADAPIEAGLQFQATGPEGQPLMGTIVEIADGIVTVDFNHPLAGQTLHFAVEIVSIRDATDAEKEQGHAS